MKKQTPIIIGLVILTGLLLYFGVFQTMFGQSGMTCSIVSPTSLSCSLSGGSFGVGVLTDLNDENILFNTNEAFSLIQNKISSYDIYQYMLATNAIAENSRAKSFMFVTSDTANKYTNNQENVCLPNSCGGTVVGQDKSCNLYSKADGYTGNLNLACDGRQNQVISYQTAQCNAKGGTFSITSTKYNEQCGQNYPQGFSCSYTTKCGGSLIYYSSLLGLEYYPVGTSCSWGSCSPTSAYYVLDYSNFMASKPFDGYTCSFTGTVRLNDRDYILNTNGYTELGEKFIKCHLLINNSDILNSDAVIKDSNYMITVDLANKYISNQCTLDGQDCRTWEQTQIIIPTEPVTPTEPFTPDTENIWDKLLKTVILWNIIIAIIVASIIYFGASIIIRKFRK